MRIKICGITRLEQAQAIAGLDVAGWRVSTLGFICVAQSPRYISADRIQEIISKLPDEIQTIGVFANAEVEAIAAVVGQTGLSGVQLHGEETLEFCEQLRQRLPQIKLIKAFRIRTTANLDQVRDYEAVVNTLLLDAYHPDAYGGTGQTLDWSSLTRFAPTQPWLLAGGLNPNNIAQALAEVSPAGIDLSSGVERSPGDKDLSKVSALLQALADTP
ncbi:MAG: phosphoribosylanthranilate isomerase [Spirulina sp. SIO3F2]|nr:phosphoribosylanthranilate isomerase [Spirulina sp. SIO3F2]